MTNSCKVYPHYSRYKHSRGDKSGVVLQLFLITYLEVKFLNAGWISWLQTQKICRGNSLTWKRSTKVLEMHLHDSRDQVSRLPRITTPLGIGISLNRLQNCIWVEIAKEDHTLLMSRHHILVSFCFQCLTQVFWIYATSPKQSHYVEEEHALSLMNFCTIACSRGPSRNPMMGIWNAHPLIYGFQVFSSK